MGRVDEPVFFKLYVDTRAQTDHTTPRYTTPHHTTHNTQHTTHNTQHTHTEERLSSTIAVRAAVQGRDKSVVAKIKLVFPTDNCVVRQAKL